MASNDERLTISVELLESLISEEDCWLDHHGGCQAHGYLSLEPGEKCPQLEAKELLAAHRAESDPTTPPDVSDIEEGSEFDGPVVIR